VRILRSLSPSPQVGPEAGAEACLRYGYSWVNGPIVHPAAGVRWMIRVRTIDFGSVYAVAVMRARIIAAPACLRIAWPTSFVWG
jgi:hypothetical protein